MSQSGANDSAHAVLPTAGGGVLHIRCTTVSEVAAVLQWSWATLPCSHVGSLSLSASAELDPHIYLLNDGTHGTTNESAPSPVSDDEERRGAKGASQESTETARSTPSTVVAGADSVLSPDTGLTVAVLDQGKQSASLLPSRGTSPDLDSTKAGTHTQEQRIPSAGLTVRSEVATTAVYRDLAAPTAAPSSPFIVGPLSSGHLYRVTVSVQFAKPENDAVFVEPETLRNPGPLLQNTTTLFVVTSPRPEPHRLRYVTNTTASINFIRPPLHRAVHRRMKQLQDAREDFLSRLPPFRPSVDQQPLVPAPPQHSNTAPRRRSSAAAATISTTSSRRASAVVDKAASSTSDQGIRSHHAAGGLDQPPPHCSVGTLGLVGRIAVDIARVKIPGAKDKLVTMKPSDPFPFVHTAKIGAYHFNSDRGAAEFIPPEDSPLPPRRASRRTHTASLRAPSDQLSTRSKMTQRSSSTPDGASSVKEDGSSDDESTDEDVSSDLSSDQSESETWVLRPSRGLRIRNLDRAASYSVRVAPLSYDGKRLAVPGEVAYFATPCPAHLVAEALSTKSLHPAPPSISAVAPTQHAAPEASTTEVIPLPAEEPVVSKAVKMASDAGVQLVVQRGEPPEIQLLRGRARILLPYLGGDGLPRSRGRNRNGSKNGRTGVASGPGDGASDSDGEKNSQHRVRLTAQWPANGRWRSALERRRDKANTVCSAFGLEGPIEQTDDAAARFRVADSVCDFYRYRRTVCMRALRRRAFHEIVTSVRPGEGETMRTGGLRPATKYEVLYEVFKKPKHATPADQADRSREATVASGDEAGPSALPVAPSLAPTSVSTAAALSGGGLAAAAVSFGMSGLMGSASIDQLRQLSTEHVGNDDTMRPDAPLADVVPLSLEQSLNERSLSQESPRSAVHADHRHIALRGGSVLPPALQKEQEESVDDIDHVNWKTVQTSYVATDPGEHWGAELDRAVPSDECPLSLEEYDPSEAEKIAAAAAGTVHSLRRGLTMNRTVSLAVDAVDHTTVTVSWLAVNVERLKALLLHVTQTRKPSARTAAELAQLHYAQAAADESLQRNLCGHAVVVAVPLPSYDSPMPAIFEELALTDIAAGRSVAEEEEEAARLAQEAFDTHATPMKSQDEKPKESDVLKKLMEDLGNDDTAKAMSALSESPLFNPSTGDESISEAARREPSVGVEDVGGERMADRKKIDVCANERQLGRLLWLYACGGDPHLPALPEWVEHIAGAAAGINRELKRRMSQLQLSPDDVPLAVDMDDSTDKDDLKLHGRSPPRVPSPGIQGADSFTLPKAKGRVPRPPPPAPVPELSSEVHRSVAQMVQSRAAPPDPFDEIDWVSPAEVTDSSPDEPRVSLAGPRLGEADVTKARGDSPARPPTPGLNVGGSFTVGGRGQRDDGGEGSNPRPPPPAPVPHHSTEVRRSVAQRVQSDLAHADAVGLSAPDAAAHHGSRPSAPALTVASADSMSAAIDDVHSDGSVHRAASASVVSQEDDSKPRYTSTASRLAVRRALSACSSADGGSGDVATGGKVPVPTHLTAAALGGGRSESGLPEAAANRRVSITEALQRRKSSLAQFDAMGALSSRRVSVNGPAAPAPDTIPTDPVVVVERLYTAGRHVVLKNLVPNTAYAVCVACYDSLNQQWHVPAAPLKTVTSSVPKVEVVELRGAPRSWAQTAAVRVPMPALVELENAAAEAAASPHARGKTTSHSRHLGGADLGLDDHGEKKEKKRATFALDDHSSPPPRAPGEPSVGFSGVSGGRLGGVGSSRKSATVPRLPKHNISYQQYTMVEIEARRLRPHGVPQTEATMVKRVPFSIASSAAGVSLDGLEYNAAFSFRARFVMQVPTSIEALAAGFTPQAQKETKWFQRSGRKATVSDRAVSVSAMSASTAMLGASVATRQIGENTSTTSRPRPALRHNAPSGQGIPCGVPPPPFDSGFHSVNARRVGPWGGLVHASWRCLPLTIDKFEKTGLTLKATGATSDADVAAATARRLLDTTYCMALREGEAAPGPLPQSVFRPMPIPEDPDARRPPADHTLLHVTFDDAERVSVQVVRARTFARATTAAASVDGGWKDARATVLAAKKCRVVLAELNDRACEVCVISQTAEAAEADEAKTPSWPLAITPKMPYEEADVLADELRARLTPGAKLKGALRGLRVEVEVETLRVEPDVSKQPDEPCAVPGDIVTTKVLSTLPTTRVGGLFPGCTYSLKLRPLVCRTSEGDTYGDWSRPLHFTTAPPIIVALEETGERSLLVSWSRRDPTQSPALKAQEKRRQQKLEEEELEKKRAEAKAKQQQQRGGYPGWDLRSKKQKAVEAAASVAVEPDDPASIPKPTVEEKPPEKTSDRSKAGDGKSGKNGDEDKDGESDEDDVSSTATEKITYQSYYALLHRSLHKGDIELRADLIPLEMPAPVKTSPTERSVTPMRQSRAASRRATRLQSLLAPPSARRGMSTAAVSISPPGGSMLRTGTGSVAHTQRSASTATTSTTPPSGRSLTGMSDRSVSMGMSISRTSRSRSRASTASSTGSHQAPPIVITRGEDAYVKKQYRFTDLKPNRFYCVNCKQAKYSGGVGRATVESLASVAGIPLQQFLSRGSSSAGSGSMVPRESRGESESHFSVGRKSHAASRAQSRAMSTRMSMQTRRSVASSGAHTSMASHASSLGSKMHMRMSVAGIGGPGALPIPWGGDARRLLIRTRAEFSILIQPSTDTTVGLQVTRPAAIEPDAAIVFGKSADTLATLHARLAAVPDPYPHAVQLRIAESEPAPLDPTIAPAEATTPRGSRGTLTGSHRSRDTDDDQSGPGGNTVRLPKLVHEEIEEDDDLTPPPRLAGSCEADVYWAAYLEILRKFRSGEELGPKEKRTPWWGIGGAQTPVHKGSLQLRKMIPWVVGLDSLPEPYEDIFKAAAEEAEREAMREAKGSTRHDASVRWKKSMAAALVTASTQAKRSKSTVGGAGLQGGEGRARVYGLDEDPCNPAEPGAVWLVNMAPPPRCKKLTFGIVGLKPGHVYSLQLRYNAGDGKRMARWTPWQEFSTHTAIKVTSLVPHESAVDIRWEVPETPPLKAASVAPPQGSRSQSTTVNGGDRDSATPTPSRARSRVDVADLLAPSPSQGIGGRAGSRSPRSPRSPLSSIAADSDDEKEEEKEKVLLGFDVEIAGPTRTAIGDPQQPTHHDIGGRAYAPSVVTFRVAADEHKLRFCCLLPGQLYGLGVKAVYSDGTGPMSGISLFRTCEPVAVSIPEIAERSAIVVASRPTAPDREALTDEVMRWYKHAVAAKTVALESVKTIPDVPTFAKAIPVVIERPVLLPVTWRVMRGTAKTYTDGDPSSPDLTVVSIDAFSAMITGLTANSTATVTACSGAAPPPTSLVVDLSRPPPSASPASPARTLPLPGPQPSVMVQRPIPSVQDRLSLMSVPESNNPLQPGAEGGQQTVDGQGVGIDDDFDGVPVVGLSAASPLTHAALDASMGTVASSADGRFSIATESQSTNPLSVSRLGDLSTTHSMLAARTGTMPPVAVSRATLPGIRGDSDSQPSVISAVAASHAHVAGRDDAGGDTEGDGEQARGPVADLASLAAGVPIPLALANQIGVAPPPHSGPSRARTLRFTSDTMRPLPNADVGGDSGTGGPGDTAVPKPAPGPTPFPPSVLQRNNTARVLTLAASETVGDGAPNAWSKLTSFKTPPLPTATVVVSNSKVIDLTLARPPMLPGAVPYVKYSVALRKRVVTDPDDDSDGSPLSTTPPPATSSSNAAAQTKQQQAALAARPVDVVLSGAIKRRQASPPVMTSSSGDDVHDTAPVSPETDPPVADTAVRGGRRSPGAHGAAKVTFDQPPLDVGDEDDSTSLAAKPTQQSDEYQDNTGGVVEDVAEDWSELDGEQCFELHSSGKPCKVRITRADAGTAYSVCIRPHVPVSLLDSAAVESAEATMLAERTLHLEMAKAAREAASEKKKAERSGTGLRRAGSSRIPRNRKSTQRHVSTFGADSPGALSPRHGATTVTVVPPDEASSVSRQEDDPTPARRRAKVQRQELPRKIKAEVAKAFHQLVARVMIDSPHFFVELMTVNTAPHIPGIPRLYEADAGVLALWWSNLREEGVATHDAITRAGLAPQTVAGLASAAYVPPDTAKSVTERLTAPKADAWASKPARGRRHDVPVPAFVPTPASGAPPRATKRRGGDRPASAPQQKQHLTPPSKPTQATVATVRSLSTSPGSDPASSPQRPSRLRSESLFCGGSGDESAAVGATTSPKSARVALTSFAPEVDASASSRGVGPGALVPAPPKDGRGEGGPRRPSTASSRSSSVSMIEPADDDRRASLPFAPTGPGGSAGDRLLRLSGGSAESLFASPGDLKRQARAAAAAFGVVSFDAAAARGAMGASQAHHRKSMIQQIMPGVDGTVNAEGRSRALFDLMTKARAEFIAAAPEEDAPEDESEEPQHAGRRRSHRQRQTLTVHHSTSERTTQSDRHGNDDDDDGSNNSSECGKARTLTPPSDSTAERRSQEVDGGGEDGDLDRASSHASSMSLLSIPPVAVLFADAPDVWKRAFSGDNVVVQLQVARCGGEVRAFDNDSNGRKGSVSGGAESGRDRSASTGRGPQRSRARASTLGGLVSGSRSMHRPSYTDVTARSRSITAASSAAFGYDPRRSLVHSLAQHRRSTAGRALSRSISPSNNPRFLKISQFMPVTDRPATDATSFVRLKVHPADHKRQVSVKQYIKGAFFRLALRVKSTGQTVYGPAVRLHCPPPLPAPTLSVLRTRKAEVDIAWHIPASIRTEHNQLRVYVETQRAAGTPSNPGALKEHHWVPALSLRCAVQQIYLTNLAPGERYAVRLRVVSSFGASPMSKASLFTTQPTAAVCKPSPLRPLPPSAFMDEQASRFPYPCNRVSYDDSIKALRAKQQRQRAASSSQIDLGDLEELVSSDLSFAAIGQRAPSDFNAPPEATPFHVECGRYVHGDVMGLSYVPVMSESAAQRAAAKRSPSAVALAPRQPQPPAGQQRRLHGLPIGNGKPEVAAAPQPSSEGASPFVYPMSDIYADAARAMMVRTEGRAATHRRLSLARSVSSDDDVSVCSTSVSAAREINPLAFALAPGCPKVSVAAPPPPALKGPGSSKPQPRYH